MDKKPVEDKTNNPTGKWLRLPKVSLSRKDLSRRMRRVEGVTVRHARKFVIKRMDNMREVRRHILIWILLVAYVIAATVLQLTWYQQGYRTDTGDSGGTYAEAVKGPLNTLDPLFASSSAELSASRLMFSSLMTYDTTGHLNYDLASNMTVDPTGKIYTITLRSDAKWDDGYAVTADDVAFTLGLIKNPNVHSTISGWDDIGVTVTNPTTIQFTLPDVYAAFPHALNFPIVPQHILKNVDPGSLRESTFSNAPVGSGPFEFRLLQDINLAVGQRVVHMVRNTDYYQGVPKIERFQLEVYDSDDAIIAALSSAQVNAAVDLTATEMSQVNQKRYDIQRKPIDSGVYALLNTTSSLLQDVQIRRALQVGTDTTALQNSLGAGTPALYLPFVNGQITGDVPAAPVYNVDNAKAILDADGWKLDGGVRKKDGVTLHLNVVTINDSDFEKVLEKLVGQWRTLGVDVTTTVVDPNNAADKVVQDVLEPRAYDVLIYELTIGADPDVYAYWHSSQANQFGFNFSNYSNPLSDSALASARSRLEPDLRNAKYLTFARQWLSDVPAIGLYQSTVQYVSNRNISTVSSTDNLVAPTDRYDNILYWTVNTKTVFTTP